MYSARLALVSASFSVRVKFLVLVRGLVSGGVARLLSHGPVAHLIQAPFQPSSLSSGWATSANHSWGFPLLSQNRPTLAP